MLFKKPLHKKKLKEFTVLVFIIRDTDTFVSKTFESDKQHIHRLEPRYYRVKCSGMFTVEWEVKGMLEMISKSKGISFASYQVLEDLPLNIDNSEEINVVDIPSPRN